MATTRFTNCDRCSKSLEEPTASLVTFKCNGLKVEVNTRGKDLCRDCIVYVVNNGNFYIGHSREKKIPPKPVPRYMAPMSKQFKTGGPHRG